MSVKLGRYKYIATQGPCPRGFHIPTKTEWQNLVNVWTGLGQTVNQGYLFAEYIKLPFAGYRSYSNATVYVSGTGQYASSTQNSSNANKYDSFYISSQSGRAMTVGDTFKADAKSIRPFKDSPVIPTSSWTKMYGTSIEAGGIFWDASNGLISLSSNGQNWITISDKNVGATVVWNNGDTLSESNCGGHFQWGNNYMFPFTGTVTTSSTQVDASSYGPGNWYDSSTFITRSSGPYDWSSVQNDNLWGGVDGNVWKDVESIKEEWKPGSNTIAYYEFNDNINDTSGNNRNLSMKNGSFTYGTIGEYKYVNIPQSAWTNGLSNFPFNINSNTVSFWIKNPYYTKSDGNAMVADFWRGGSYGTSRLCTYSGAIKIDNVSYTISDDTKRYYVCIVYDNGQTKLYVNGEYVGANTCGLASGTTSVSFALNNAPDTNSSTYSGQCQMSQLIFESIKRTTQEISNYYNSTKGTYTGEGGGNDEVNGHILDEHSMFPQGPAPDGFHVPTKDERVALKDILVTTFGLASNSTTMGTYLKIPTAGDRNYGNTNVGYVGSRGYYWSSSPGGSDGYAYYLYFDSSLLVVDTNAYSLGCSIRCFKNFPVKPDSSWTTLYDGSSVASGAGVFYNASLGLISVSGDGVTWYTIQDKNLGATTVYNQGDTVSDANSGYFYQWGNNYGFAHSGTLTTSSTKVDATGYGPGNYYSSSTWITTNPRNSTANTNLWGGVSKSELKQYYSFNLLNEYIGEYHECNVNTMGPCDDGFHIPTRQEWHDLYDIGYALGLWDTTNYGKQLQLQFNMPVCGKLNNDGTYTSSPTDAVYWCADKENASYGRDIWLRTTTDIATVDDATTMIRGGSIRPFRNMPLIPTTSDSNWSIPTGSNPANGGIYDNETEGVISISADGAHWMTLADKNCGATTKWYLNSTMSEANCGRFYQWGNNHGFPFTGATKTSSTAVDASDYGPFSEYYDNDTFITTSPWDTSDNRNLWGGVSGPTRNCDIGITPEPITFLYTGQDQQYIVSKTGKYRIECFGAGSNTASGGYAKGIVELTKGTVLSIVVGQSGSSTSGTTYGFGGSSNYGSDRAGGGLSGVFLGDGTVQPTDSARALVIAGGAGGGTSGRAGGAGGGETGATGGGSNYGTAGGGGTQTGRGSGGNTGANQFNGGNGSGTYGWGGGGGRWGGNGSIGDGSGDDDKGAGGGSGYVISTAESRSLVQGGGSTSGNHGSVYIEFYQQPSGGQEYIILSEGGDVNLYNELSLSGLQCLDNATTYWAGRVQSTDTFGLHYMQVPGTIVGFEVKGQTTDNNYDGFDFQLSPDGQINSNNIRNFINYLYCSSESNWYNQSSYGGVHCGYVVNSSGTTSYEQVKNASAVYVTFKGVLSNGVWNIDISTSNGQSWSTTITLPAALGDLKYVGFRAGRWYTGYSSNFISCKLTLE